MILNMISCVCVSSYFSPVACLNNDKSVMSCPYAWRVLGILPILKASACTNTDETWQRLRSLNLYHRCMDPIIAEINEQKPTILPLG